MVGRFVANILGQAETMVVVEIHLSLRDCQGWLLIFRVASN